jgi:uncharacterized protein
MKNVFVDTHYWVAIINPHDQWHQRAHDASGTLSGVKLFTTDTVLTEVMNYFSGQGEHLRRAGAANVRAILANSGIETIFVERSTFLSGFDLYEARPDKSYSLTDCISMNLMRERGISEVLTHDAHFTQEGFEILL